VADGAETYTSEQVRSHFISKEVIVVWSLEAKKSLSEIYNYILRIVHKMQRKC
jgi:hypothetical protein